MGGIMPLGPNQKNNAAAPERQTPQSQFTIGEPIVLHRDRWKIECSFQLRQIDPMLGDICEALRFRPSDRAHIVDAI
jgi:hypothetical protein